MRRLLAVVTACLLALGVLTAPRAQASTEDPSLAPTPYMGWNTYYGKVNPTEADVLAVARSMIDRGLVAAGYDIVWLDGGWTTNPVRDADGRPAVDPKKFPNGMKAFTDKIHAMGLRVGIYTDAGPQNSGCALGSLDHAQLDANTFAEWGFDAVKIDFLCGWTAKVDPQEAMTKVATAMHNNSSGRPMIVNICNPVTSPYWGDYPEDQQSIGTWAYASKIAESWRTFTDVGFQGSILFSDVLRNYDANARHPEVAGPGHFSDPDYLGPELGMSTTEFRTQMSLWAIAAAPLVIGSDPRKLSDESIAILTDPDVLAVDQDRLGIQGTRLGDAGTTEVWVKPLADGSKAVALLNRGDVPAEVATTGSALGFGDSRLRIKDLWTDQVSDSLGKVRATVPAHGTVLLKVAPTTGKPGAPRVHVATPTVTAVDGAAVPTASEALIGAGSTVTVKVVLTNDGNQPLKQVDLDVALPEGWTATEPASVKVLAPGKSVTFTVTLKVPADAALGTQSVRFSPTASGQSVGDPAALPVLVAPTAPTGTTNLAHHPWVSATSGWMKPTIDRSVGGWTPLVVNGVTYTTGIGVASVSEIRWFLDAKCSRLTGLAGIDDAVKFGPEGATVTYTILGDGKVLWQTDVVRRDELQKFSVDVTGVRDLRLVVGDAGDTGYNDRANWMNLEATCG